MSPGIGCLHDVLRHIRGQPILGIRIGSAVDGSLKYFVPGTRPEGLSADEAGNIFAGLTAGCQTSRSGGCLQKFVLAKQQGSKKKQ